MPKHHGSPNWANVSLMGQVEVDNAKAPFWRRRSSLGWVLFGKRVHSSLWETFGWRVNWKEATPFPFMGIDSFYSVFGNQNETVLFFVWLKSWIKRGRSVHCLVRELYKVWGENNKKSARVRSFRWSENILNIWHIYFKVTPLFIL